MYKMYHLIYAETKAVTERFMFTQKIVTKISLQVKR